PGRKSAEEQEQVMKTDQRLRVSAELCATRSTNRANDFLFVDCADLCSRLFQFVEQVACIFICHMHSTKLLPQSTGRTQSKSGKSKDKSTTAARRRTKRRYL